MTQTRIAIYPGTFDPITNGHLDIIRRAARLVDRLVIGVSTNAGKGPLFDVNADLGTGSPTARRPPRPCGRCGRTAAAGRPRPTGAA